MTTTVDERKRDARRRIWDRLDHAGVVIGGSSHGRIPLFAGADQAADLLATLPEWRRAKVIKAVPDKAQLPVRVRALNEGKTVYMAVPKIADEHAFRRLVPDRLAVPFEQAASSRTAVALGEPVHVEDVEPVNMVICGSVAVNYAGVRLGKGAGYSDIEVALLAEAGAIGPNTIIVTTVHPLQIVDDDLPETEHDFSVDIIVTEDEIVTCGPPRRPAGLVWDHLSAGKIAEIPVLSNRASRRRRPTS